MFFLRDDLVELIQHARAHDLYTNLITGGTLLDGEKLGLFREAGLDPAFIELISHGEEELLVPTADEVAEPRNRRVEIAVR